MHNIITYRFVLNEAEEAGEALADEEAEDEWVEPSAAGTSLKPCATPDRSTLLLSDFRDFNKQGVQIREIFFTHAHDEQSKSLERRQTLLVDCWFKANNWMFSDSLINLWFD